MIFLTGEKQSILTLILEYIFLIFVKLHKINKVRFMVRIFLFILSCTISTRVRVAQITLPKTVFSKYYFMYFSIHYIFSLPDITFLSNLWYCNMLQWQSGKQCFEKCGMMDGFWGKRIFFKVKTWSTYLLVHIGNDNST